MFDIAIYWFDFRRSNNKIEYCVLIKALIYLSILVKVYRIGFCIDSTFTVLRFFWKYPLISHKSNSLHLINLSHKVQSVGICWLMEYVDNMLLSPCLILNNWTKDTLVIQMTTKDKYLFRRINSNFIWCTAVCATLENSLVNRSMFDPAIIHCDSNFSCCFCLSTQQLVTLTLHINLTNYYVSPNNVHYTANNGLQTTKILGNSLNNHHLWAFWYCIRNKANQMVGDEPCILMRWLIFTEMHQTILWNVEPYGIWLENILVISKFFHLNASVNQNSMKIIFEFIQTNWFT